MTLTAGTQEVEDRHLIPFLSKHPFAIERGDGVYVWDEKGRRYLDFTSGWGVTCIGHASPVIARALAEQSSLIIQNPDGGLTYSPARARCLKALVDILPQHLTRIFFSSSGAEANDAAIKLARKITGRMKVISAEMSFHGRTISTASATGQAEHRDKFNPLMPGYAFVPFGNEAAMDAAIDADTAAVILEPIQGEGGVRIPAPNYLPQVARLCRKHGALLICDEVQTGFFRTGPAFTCTEFHIEPDILTMAKGIAGGFPFGAFAMTDALAERVEKGDHGGTYCGNPLGCAVSAAVIEHLRAVGIERHVRHLGDRTLQTLRGWRDEFPGRIADVRGRGLLIALEMISAEFAARVHVRCRENGLLLNRKHGTVLRIFPALTISPEEMEEGLGILHRALEASSA